MSLTPTLGSTLALYRKLERERYRAFHHRNRLHKADHFYNFCVTAHAMRDYYIKETGTPKSEFHERLNRVRVLVAVRDIANSSKHFKLDNAPPTKRVRPGKSELLDVYLDDRGEVVLNSVAVPEYFVTLADGTRYDLCAFMESVLHVWRVILTKGGFRVRRQSFNQLYGAVGSGAVLSEAKR